MGGGGGGVSPATPPHPTPPYPPINASHTHPASRSLPLASTALLLLSLSPFRPIAPPASPPPPPAGAGGGGRTQQEGGERQLEVRSAHRQREFMRAPPNPQHTARVCTGTQPHSHTPTHSHKHKRHPTTTTLFCVYVSPQPGQHSGLHASPPTFAPPSHLLPLTLAWVCRHHQPAWAWTWLCAGPGEQQQGGGRRLQGRGQGRQDTHTVGHVRVQV